MSKEKLKSLIINRLDKVSDEPRFAEVLERCFDEIYKMGADTLNKWGMFLAQCSHESVGFTVLEENLRYSKKALLRVFPKYFSERSAELAAYKPQVIGDIVYSNRMGNGPFDGYRYRGRGSIMITGTNNYKLYGYYETPDLLLEQDKALITAGEFFTNNDLWDPSEKLLTKVVTRTINGGYNGLDDRQERLDDFLEDVVVEAVKYNRLLKVGSRGPSVKAFQEALVKLDYLEEGEADGIFGDHTKEEVIDYQIDNGLVVDGIVGRKTYDHLMQW